MDLTTARQTVQTLRATAIELNNQAARLETWITAQEIPLSTNANKAFEWIKLQPDLVQSVGVDVWELADVLFTTKGRLLVDLREDNRFIRVIGSDGITRIKIKS